MIRKIFIYNAQGTDPHENLAAEKALMDALQPIMEAGAQACVKSEVDEAKLNREQRRAMQ